MLIRITSAYRTTSTIALQVIAAVTPIDLLVGERKYLYDHSGEDAAETLRVRARERSLEEWQRRWTSNEGKGAWTKKIIPNIIQWVMCKHRQVDYWLTQVLSGHGSFRAYTKRIGKDEEDTCVYCGQIDTVEHTLFDCQRWVPARHTAYTELGLELTVENLIEEMLESGTNWRTVHGMIKTIMMAKEREELERQRRERVGNPL